MSYTGGSVEVISAVAFSGSAVWTSVLSTSWGSSSNWSDANSLHGVPGLSGSNGHDTATFSNSGSQTSVNLTGMNPSLVALSFSSSNYTLSGGSLTLQSDLGMASISVNGGTQSIASLLTLAGSADVTVSDSEDLLTLSGDIQGSGTLLKGGAGRLILSGTGDTYSGGTDVTAGELICTAYGALPTGSNLAIGANAAIIFGSTVAGEQAAAPTMAAPLVTSGGVAAVPEPGTLVFLAVGVLLGMWRKGKSR